MFKLFLLFIDRLCAFLAEGSNLFKYHLDVTLLGINKISLFEKNICLSSSLFPVCSLDEALMLQILNAQSLHKSQASMQRSVIEICKNKYLTKHAKVNKQ